MIWEATERISSCRFHSITKPSSLKKTQHIYFRDHTIVTENVIKTNISKWDELLQLLTYPQCRAASPCPPGWPRPSGTRRRSWGRSWPRPLSPRPPPRPHNPRKPGHPEHSVRWCGWEVETTFVNIRYKMMVMKVMMKQKLLPYFW